VRIAPAKIEIQTYESLIRRAFGECGVKPPLPVEVEPGDLLATAT